MGFFDKVRDVLSTSDAERAEKTAGQSAAGQPEAKAADDGTGTAETYRTVTVQPGDTLSAIAERHGVSWQEMARLNSLDNPDLIYPGQVFKVPHG